MNVEKLENLLNKKNIPKYRLKQIKQTIFKDAYKSFLEITNLPLNLREILQKEVEILPFKSIKVLTSKDKRSFKALVTLKDNFLIETVLISPKNNVWSACVSSQVGCSLGCLFCATGKMGFKRNLTDEEISSQALFWRQYIKENNIEGEFSNIVFMGMGEPFLNWDNVKKAIKNLIDPEMFAFRNRSISISTSGILNKIDDLVNEFPQVNLAISLHFADNDKRNQFMKVNKLYNLENLEKSLKNYFSKTHRKVFLEYILLKNINDTDEDLKNLIKFIEKNGKHLLHVNLIRYNYMGENFQSSSKEQTLKFKNLLEKKGISVTIRKSLGEDIAGACGQLAG